MTTTGNGNGARPPAEPPKTIAVPSAQAGEVLRKEFGTTQVARSGETASSAVAAQAVAREQARYVVALQRPRDMDLTRVRLLASCKRPRFAEAARYRKPIGQGIEGPSIRLAEEAARCMGNIAVDVFTVYDDDRQRIIRVCATDLETNLPYSTDVTVAKTVERNKVAEGQTLISQRIGSRGQVVYVVTATDDDILNKQNAITSKALRTNLLRLVPADLLEEALDQVYATLADRNAKDPAAERKALMDGFASINIFPDKLKEYLGHDLDVTTPAELIELRGVYTAIRDGEATWIDVMEHKRRTDTPPADNGKQPQGDGGGAATPETKPAEPTKPKGQQSLDEVAAAARAKREREAAAAKPQPSGGPPPASAPASSDDDERSATDPLKDDPNWRPPGDDDVPPWAGGRGK